MPNADRIRGSRWAAVRRIVLAEEDTCWLCDAHVDLSLAHPDPFSASVDHVIPLNAGGEEMDRGNCRLAHLRCNLRRQDSMARRPGKPAVAHMRDWT